MFPYKIYTILFYFFCLLYFSCLKWVPRFIMANLYIYIRKKLFDPILSTLIYLVVCSLNWPISRNLNQDISSQSRFFRIPKWAFEKLVCFEVTTFLSFDLGCDQLESILWDPPFWDLHIFHQKIESQVLGPNFNVRSSLKHSFN